VGTDFDWSFFKSYLVKGTVLSLSKDSTSNGVVISKTLANLLNLEIGTSFMTSFVPSSPSESIRYRMFTVKGIYETNFEEFDKKFIIADIGHVQKLNNWKTDQIAGYEITIDNFDDLDQMYNSVMDQVGFTFRADGSRLMVRTIVEMNPPIFDWLNLLDMNVWVILALMVVVAGMNMISSLLVIILERTSMIGILKSLGAKNASIRKIFLYNAAFIVGFGLLWGNILGLGICFLQYYFRLIPLDPQTYFIPYVPISVTFLQVALLSVGTLVITILMLILPSVIITKVSPAVAIRFE
jgi:lipoprotein-releasing system permease protein